MFFRFLDKANGAEKVAMVSERDAILSDLFGMRHEVVEAAVTVQKWIVTVDVKVDEIGVGHCSHIPDGGGLAQTQIWLDLRVAEAGTIVV